MAKKTYENLKEYLTKWATLDYIAPEDIPNIELYMDQVTTFMEKELHGNKRYAEDKIMTKTMINNYSKNGLLPPSNKKKYSKEHIILLIYIYYLKNLLSIQDIETLLQPMTSKHFDSTNTISMADIYSDMFALEQEYGIKIRKSIEDVYEMANAKCESQDDYLKTFAFIIMLSYDIYAKKQLVEKLIDSLQEAPVSKAEKKEAKQQEKRTKKSDKNSTKPQ